jgi:hypothetical protein
MPNVYTKEKNQLESSSIHVQNSTVTAKYQRNDKKKKELQLSPSSKAEYG